MSKHYLNSLILGLAATLSACSSRELSKDDLRLTVGDLRTYAAASKMLSEENSTQHLTNTFFTQQAYMLSGKVEDSLKGLDAAAKQYETERQHAANLGTRLGERLHRMKNGVASQDDVSFFAGAASEAKALEDALKDPAR